jgi:hypothetical protein
MRVTLHKEGGGGEEGEGGRGGRHFISEHFTLEQIFVEIVCSQTKGHGVCFVFCTNS